MSVSGRTLKRLSGVMRSVLASAAVWPALIMAAMGCDSPEVVEIDLGERVDDAELAKMVPGRDQDVLRFGFDPRGAPDEDARQYLPLLKYLEAATGSRFELRFTPRRSTIADELGAGRVQFAAIGAETYIQAHARFGIVPLVRGVNSEGRAKYQSVIVVAPDSPIHSVEDLGGKRFAFGNASSTQGHLIPRIVLYKNGMLLDDLAGYEYTGSHLACANAVAAGRFDVGGMQDVLGKRLAEEGLLRIIHTSEFYPSSGIAANKDVPSGVINKVKQALLDFEPKGAHAQGLYHWARTEMANGFTEAVDEDYVKLRSWSERFGLLVDPPREAVP